MTADPNPNLHILQNMSVRVSKSERAFSRQHDNTSTFKSARHKTCFLENTCLQGFSCQQDETLADPSPSGIRAFRSYWESEDWVQGLWLKM